MLMEEDAVHHFRWWRRSFYLEPFRVFIFSRLIHGIDWSGNDLAEVIAMIKWGFPPVLFAFVKFECRETIFFSSTREHRHIFRSFKANVSRSNDKKNVVKIVIAKDCQSVWAHQKVFRRNTMIRSPLLSSALISSHILTVLYAGRGSVVCTQFARGFHSNVIRSTEYRSQAHTPFSYLLSISEFSLCVPVNCMS